MGAIDMILIESEELFDAIYGKIELNRVVMTETKMNNIETSQSDL